MNHLTATGVLDFGIELNNQVHKNYLIREPLARDYFAAEKQVAINLIGTGLGINDVPYQMETALVATCIEKLGDLGLVDLNVLEKLKPSDLNILTTEVKLLERGLTLASVSAESESKQKKTLAPKQQTGKSN